MTLSVVQGLKDGPAIANAPLCPGFAICPGLFFARAAHREAGARRAGDKGIGLAENGAAS
jgi:hypothetical protein